MDEAIKQIEKSNIDLEPEVMDADSVREFLSRYAKAKKLVSYGETVLAAKLDDAAAVARATGVSVGKAKAVVDTGNSLKSADELRDAFRSGEVSSEQAAEIAKAEVASPGSTTELLKVAQEESFQALSDQSRRLVLEAEQHRGLAQRQHQARRARSHHDDLGMISINLLLEPAVGAPLVNRAEVEAGRLFRAAKRDGLQEPFERHLADAYANLMLAGATIKAPKPELVVLVSHEVTQRGWKDIREGEMCKIPGVGPISPERAKEIASDAFLNGLFYDGTDLRHFRRWTRNTPVEVLAALRLGEPPEFDGVKCIECGRRFRNDKEHSEPHVAGGTASTGNLKWRCYGCHKNKTAEDRKNGKLTPPDPDAERGPPGP
ncbi:MAG TPA: HNH endonuclease [Actinomycetota bacterium]|nr:HNH endonuclease [Actinomycetota bacterium]